MESVTVVIIRCHVTLSHCHGDCHASYQAHFYKDVEMAEVMTDNNPEIANILAQYEIVENGDLDEPEVEKPPPKKKRRKKRN